MSYWRFYIEKEQVGALRTLLGKKGTYHPLDMYHSHKHYDLTPLIHAIVKNNTEIVELFLQHGASPNFGNSLIPLHEALEIQNKELEKLWDQEEIYMNPESEDIRPTSSDVYRKMTTIMKLLIKHGAVSNEYLHRKTFFRPLHHAIIGNNTETLCLLLENGGKSQWTDYGHKSVLRSAMKLADKTCRNIVLTHLLKFLAEDESEPSFAGARMQNCELFQYLLKTDFNSTWSLEIEKMKKEKVFSDSNLTVFDVLSKKFKKLAKDLKNENCLVEVGDLNFEFRFPIYSYAMQYRIRSALEYEKV